MKKGIFIGLSVLFILFFALTQCFKLAKYTARGEGNRIIDGSAYVESGEYYFNCDDGFFIKRIPPPLPLDELRAGSFKYASGDNEELQPLLKKYTQQPGWEEGFEYILTTSLSSQVDDRPKVKLFSKYVTIEGVDFSIAIIEENSLLTVHIIKDSPDLAKGYRTHAEAIEEAKNSCIAPQ